MSTTLSSWLELKYNNNAVIIQLQLVALVRRIKDSDTVVITGEFIGQKGKLNASEIFLNGRCTLSVAFADNWDRLLQLYADNHLFLSSTNFRDSSRSTVTWSSYSAGNLS